MIVNPAPSLEQTFEEKYAQEEGFVKLALRFQEDFQAYNILEAERYVASGMAELLPAGEDTYYTEGEATDDQLPSLLTTERGTYRFCLTRQESPELFALFDEKKWLEANAWRR